MRRVLVIRLGALGDIIHALPAAATLRASFPEVRLDWLVDARHRALLELVPVVDERIVLDTRGGWRGFHATICRMRAGRYDVAIDLQGLLKSAVLTRLSGARRAVGFSRPHLREGLARFFYTEVHDPPRGMHVLEKNLALVERLGASTRSFQFPFAAVSSDVLSSVMRLPRVREHGRFALLNPGAAWPNKRWPPDRFGALAGILFTRHALPTVVAWGPGEESLAAAVSQASAGAAHVAPATTLRDLLALVRAASLLVSGDTGPLHLAAACGTPIVGIYGPTDPRRNGPWSRDDVSVSRNERCRCHHKRRCIAPAWCLADISVDEVAAAADRRLLQGSFRA
jgi:heptosyltransferase I